MRRHNNQEINRLSTILLSFSRNHFPLPGIIAPADRQVFIKQLIDSIRRVNFVRTIASRPISPLRADPNNVDLFDPVRAAVHYKNIGEVEEACWLVFLITHFGVHPRSRWRYLQEVYGKLNDRPFWTWQEVVASPTDFRSWLLANEAHISRGSSRGFGGHRRYTSLSATSPIGTGAAVSSYIAWVQRHGNHRSLINSALVASRNDAGDAFEYLNRSMEEVVSFGRLARFDYLTMLGKTGLAPITPPHPYLKDATGPLAGARLMLQGSVAVELSILELERRLIELGNALDVDMQIIEDSLCNWQKHPSDYRYFRG